MALGLVAPNAPAADDKTVEEQVRRLSERLQQIERRNQELERQLRELQKTGAPSVTRSEPRDGRLEKLERSNESLQRRVDEMSVPPVPVETTEEPGPSIEAGLIAVGQQVNAGGAADGRRQARLNYRGDVTAEVAAGFVGEAQGTALAHVRFGQGNGVALRPTHTSTVNSVGFETAAGPDDSFAILAQAFYQLEWPLQATGFNEQKGSRIELTLGKIDVFGFFDQNAVAADEAGQFLNNAFVHNPLLDSGGDIGADAYGFAPGARLGYTHVGENLLNWGVSLGAFAAGSGSNLSGGLHRPFTIAQFEVSPMQINGEPRATYRLYAWTNGRTMDLAGVEQRHSGLGVSVDQRIGREWNLFGRLGRRTAGDGTFDRALTLGFEHGGRAWGRRNDAVGVAVGWLRTSRAWRAATADGTLTGYAADGNERIAEIYYRLKVNEHLHVSPDFQLIHRPGGNGAAPAVRVFGVRGTFGF
jgi:hypothetical protein